MKIAYFDCFSGAAGDMFLGSLIDAGLDFSLFETELAKLNLPGYRLTAEKVSRSSIGGTKLDVHLEHIHHHDHHDHDHNTAHSHEHHHSHEHDHEREHHHSHEHDHEREHHHNHNHDHEHEHHHNHEHGHNHEQNHEHGRNLVDILKLIDQAPLPDTVKQNSSRIFRRLAEAEGSVHGKPPEEVHFHEVGAVDSIVDIVGAALALHLLDVDRVYCSPFRLGTGSVTCAHGELPVPVPATVKLLRGCPVIQTDTVGELTTPSGAAILSTLAAGFGPMPECKIISDGYGAGTRDTPGKPNLLRVIIGETDLGGYDADTVSVIEANIDDMSPEYFGAITDRLLAAGALDATLAPIQMKKGRPAFLISVISPPDKAAKLQEIILRETSTFGVRTRREQRMKLQRREETVQTPYGEIRIKIGLLDGERIKAKPEYEDCVRAANSHNVSFVEVYEAAVRSVDR